ncbi:hypothetical protein F5X68DRAFT_244879 [Plectosphaerella plurivora]|uniref:Uncharacterized protein n=1 Tax=Plectosphaerella plurivora TaxID=936078 RepID=A0A9P9A8A1_9PEZI|nr:hypothetical protein F5X68DRAFT_244879 [Plectosphaerella plurivora]
MHGYDENDALAAIRGNLPLSSLNSSNIDPTLLFCIIRGIRHHPDFANALRRETWVLQYPALLRAINARDIMNDIVPSMETDEEVPYCIWHPEIASEATYRALAERYPHMRYQVGRACAAAGYVDLWRDLALLPDISIAEEARDNQANPGSRLILEAILKEPVKWLVMNDYTRTVSADAPLPARFGLNGDTAVRSTLDIKRSLGELGGFWTFGDRGYLALSGGSPFVSSLSFNITEDWNIDAEYGACEDAGTDAEMATLLWNPLPDHLPEGNKDVLILMAAYHGDIDRYARLRRPTRPLPQETACIQRGIYHNTMFARWWAEQPNNGEFQAAINARYIMNNDPSRITVDTPAFALPSVIWYPSWACAETYREVVSLCPAMKPAAARAAIVADHQDLWDELLDSIDPSPALLAEASWREGETTGAQKAPLSL